MFNINFEELVHDLLPKDLRKPIILAKIYSKIHPLQESYDAFIYKIQFNSQVASFETFLNDQYSLPYVFANRASLIASTSIIYIETTAAVRSLYLYNVIENRLPVYLVNDYNASNPYSEGEFCADVTDNFVYRSKVNANVGNTPNSSPSEWEVAGVIPFIWNVNDPTLNNDFIVWVPNTLSYNADQLNAQIKQYKIDGKKYIIQTY